MRIQIVMRLVGQLILIVAGIMLVPFVYGLTMAAVTGGLLYYYGQPSTT